MFWREQRLKWTDEHGRTLRALEVSEDGPGTVLRDFQMLLSFVRERELPVSKTYQLPPRKMLPEINARLAQSIELGLKQPQLKSYPHIQGLYLLLRASGLGCIRGTPSKPVLAIDEAVYGPDHPNVAIVLNNLGLVLEAEGKLAEAKITSAPGVRPRASAATTVISGPSARARRIVSRKKTVVDSSASPRRMRMPGSRDLQESERRTGLTALRRRRAACPSRR